MAPPAARPRRSSLAAAASGASPRAAAEAKPDAKPRAADAKPSAPALPSLDELRAAIPPECFESNVPLSLLYLFGYGAVLASAALTYPLLAGSAAGLALYAAFYGTFMWAMFVIGHDAGHGTFSRSPLLNGIVGHVAHAPLLVPFYPWALSHHHHHLHHNHVTNDFSHFWLTPEARKGMNALSEAFADSNLVLLLMTPIHFALYLFPGLPDGSHVVPWGYLWERTRASRADRARCVLSTLAVAACAAAIYRLGLGWAYFAPWFVYNSWLFVVTYMQHHGAGTRVFTDGTWGFVRGGLETVDRVMGWGLDPVTLYITSDHLVHHLFFRSIPHYHLRRATEGLRKSLEAKGALALHQRVDYASPLHYLGHFVQTMLHGGFTDFQLVV